MVMRLNQKPLNCWVETLDGGELYGEEIEWDKAPKCDRFVVLFYSRVATYGPDYTFRHQCSECGGKFEWV